MNPYFGALGFLCLYTCKILGTNLVRYSLMKHLPEGLEWEKQAQSSRDGFYM